MRAHTLLPFLAVALLAACQLDDGSRKNDVVIKNGGSVILGKVLVNGVDHGALPPGGVLTLEDVGTGSIVVQSFRAAADQAPCATYETPGLRRGEVVHHTFDCSAR